MAIIQEDIIYMLTKTDVEDIAEIIGIKKLTKLHYQTAKKFFSSSRKRSDDGGVVWLLVRENLYPYWRRLLQADILPQ